MKQPYDALGRVTGRSINGTANASSWSYDAMNRVTGIVNPLGTFTPAYVDQGASGGDKGTTRLASMTYPTGQVTNSSYFSTTYDERLQEISHDWKTLGPVIEPIDERTARAISNLLNESGIPGGPSSGAALGSAEHALLNKLGNGTLDRMRGADGTVGVVVPFSDTLYPYG